MSEKKKSWEDIVALLANYGYTIATMESCTGGAVASEITSVSGASAVLHESYVTYCNEAKIKHGVPADVIEKYTVYSSETASEMAKAAMKLACSDIAIGVTGQLGRIDPNNPVDKLNIVWFAIATKSKGLEVRQIAVPDDERRKQKEFVVEHIAEVLLDVLKK